MDAKPRFATILGLGITLGFSVLAGCDRGAGGGAPAPRAETAPSAEAEAASRAQVEAAQDAFVAQLVMQPTTDPAELTSRIRAYLEANPGFYGSTVAVIGGDGRVTTSPYVYRGPNGLTDRQLAVPDYAIDQQAWLARPRDTRQALWSDPYFDAGGGEIWMVTRSVPITFEDVVTAVVTTDLPVEPPKR